MLETSLNIFDLGVLLIIGLSGLLSFFRGFIREILSLSAWVGAAIITLYTFEPVSRWIEPQVKSGVVASGLASIGIFLISLLVISIFIGFLSKFMKSGGDVGLLDNILGLVFGIARGILLVSIGYFTMTLILSENDYPEWVKHALTRPYVEKATKAVAKLAPSYLTVDDQTKDDTHALIEGFEKGDRKSPSKKPTVIKLPASDTSDPKTTSDLPSFDDLQRRMREENESKE